VGVGLGWRQIGMGGNVCGSREPVVGPKPLALFDHRPRTVRRKEGTIEA